MATKPFKYQEMFPLGPDTTEYYHLTSDYVKVENWGGHEFLVVDPEALRVIARQATHDNAFMLSYSLCVLYRTFPIHYHSSLLMSMNTR